MNVQIICPGLFGLSGPVSGSVPATPALDRLLARAEHVEAPTREPLEALAAAYGLDAALWVDSDHDLPTAPLCLLADAPDLAREGCWYHADPVHLRADRDRLLLFAGPSIAPRPDESEALVAAFNAHFAEDGLHLIATRPDRWYLRVTQPPTLRTRPLHEVAGHAVDAYLPTGPDARAWNRWQNEAQMLFYGHPVNQAREAAGRPTISGFWTWGGGRLPELSQGPALTIADHPLAKGLACAWGGAQAGLADLIASGLSNLTEPRPESALVFWDRLWWPAIEDDAATWARALVDLENFAASLVSGLASGRIDRLRIEGGGPYRFSITRALLRRFWRRRGGLGAWIERSGEATNG